MLLGTTKNFLTSISKLLEAGGPKTAEEVETIALEFGQKLPQGQLWKESEFEEIAVNVP
jgi:hypothetical protein